MNTAELVPPAKDVPFPARPADAGSIHSHGGRSRWWVYLILFLVLVGFAYFIYSRIQSATAAKEADDQKHRAVHDLPVTTATVRRGDLNLYLLGLGTVTPLKTVTLRSRVDGAITKISFTEGQKVKAGDPLLEIDPRPYEAALEQAKGQLAKDQAAQAGASWNVTQDTLAMKDHAIAEQQIHNDTATRDQAQGAIQIDQAAIDTAALNITYAHITSPIDGVIGLRLVDLGNIVHASDTTGLAVITQLNPITVLFSLPEDNIPQIQKRMRSGDPIEVQAYDRDFTERIASGTLLAIDNQIDPTTGELKLKAQFDNTENLLSPGEFVNARLLVNTITNAVLVPASAIQHSPSSTFVYVVTLDPTSDSAEKAKDKTGMTGTVKMRDVVTGVTQAAVGSDGEDTTVINSGLEPGDIVVTVGVDKLLDGSKVIAHPAQDMGRHPPTRRSTTGESTTQPTHHRRAAATMPAD